MTRANTLLAALAAGALLFAGNAASQERAPSGGQDTAQSAQRGGGRTGGPVKLSIAVQDRKLRTVMEYIAGYAGVNIVVDDTIDVSISLELNDVEWRQALELAAEKGGCIVIERAPNLFKIEKPVTVTFSFESAELAEVINVISKLAGANVVFDAEVQGTITMRLKDIPWRDALDTAVKQLGYVVVEEGRGILRIVHSTRLKTELETRSYQLRYLSPASYYSPRIQSQFFVAGMGGGMQGTRDAGDQRLAQREGFDFDLLPALKKGLSAEGSLDYIESKNVLIVTDTPIAHAAIERILRSMDVEPRQVFVDVKFISTVNTDVFDFGMDYGQSGPSASISMGAVPISLPFVLGDGGFEDGIIVTNPGIGGPQSPNVQGGGSGPFPGGASPGIVPDTIYGMLDFTGVQATLRLLKSDIRAKIVQAPRIIALDRQAATIFVGEEIRYAEARTEQGQAGGLSLTVEEARNSPVNTGFQLLMIPQIVPGSDKIILEVMPKQQALTGSGGDGAPPGFDIFRVGANDAEGTVALPRIQSGEVMTRMMLDSGQTAVIGGLSTDTETEIVRKVPFLGDIPIAGWLFKFTSNSKDRRSLIVLITPHIIASPEDTQNWLEEELTQRRDILEKELKEVFGEHPPTEGGE